MGFTNIGMPLATGQKEYLVDTEAEIANLPASTPGSTAVCIDTGKVYVVNSAGAWVVFGEE